MLWKALEQPYNFVFIHGNSQTAHNGYKFCISRTAIPRTLCLKSKIVDLGWFWNKKLKILKISITALEGETKQQNLNNNFQNFDSKLYFISSLHYIMSFVDLSMLVIEIILYRYPLVAFREFPIRKVKLKSLKC